MEDVRIKQPFEGRCGALDNVDAPALAAHLILPVRQSLVERARNLMALLILAARDAARHALWKLQRGRRTDAPRAMANVYGPALCALLGTPTSNCVLIVPGATRTLTKIAIPPEALVGARLRATCDRTLIFRSQGGERREIVHVGVGEASAAVIMRQIRGIETARALLPSGMSELVAKARLLSQSGRLVCAQAEMPGRTTHVQSLSPPRFRALIDAGLTPLRRIDEERRREPIAIPMLAVPGSPEAERVIGRLRDALVSWARLTSSGAVLAHGDYWLGNILFDGSPPQVSAIVDWERCQARGCPGVDALHLGLMSWAMWKDVPAAVLLSQAMSGGEGFAAGHAQRVAAMFRLSQHDLQHALALVWLTYVGATMQDARMPPAWRAANVDAFIPVLCEWLDGPSRRSRAGAA